MVTKSSSYNLLGKSEKWIVNHSFVIFWLPVCTIYELAFLTLWAPFYFLTLTMVVLLSWDGRASKNFSVVSAWFVSLLDRSSVFLEWLSNIPGVGC